MSSQVTSSSDDLFREYNVSMPKFAMPDEVPQPQQYPKTTTNLQSSRNPVIDRLMGKVMSKSFKMRLPDGHSLRTLRLAGVCRDRALQHPERELLHGDQPRHVERGAAEAAHAAVGGGEQEGERATAAAAGVPHGAPEVRRGGDD